MSCVEIYAIDKSGQVNFYGEAQNAFGGALFIWLTLKKKYQTRGEFLEGFEVLWDALATMQETDQWVLASTFDGAVLPKASFTVFLEHFTRFCTAFPTTTLQQECALLTRACQEEQVYGICFNQTSVNTNPWIICEEDVERPYNIERDTDHFFVTAEYFEQRRISENTKKKD